MLIQLPLADGIDARATWGHTCPTYKRLQIMPSLAEICRAGIKRIRLTRRCRGFRTRIAALQSERPALLTALAEAAWKAGLLEPTYSGTAAEVLRKEEVLEKTRREVERAGARLRQAREALDRCEQEYGERLGEINQPYHETRDAFGRLYSELQQIERERDRLAEAVPLLHESAKKIEQQIKEMGDENENPKLSRLRSDLERRKRDAIESEQRLSHLESTKLQELRPRVDAARTELESRRENLDRLKSERSSALRSMRESIERAEATLRDRERDLQAVRDEIDPLLLPLGEELNGRRIMHDSLSEYYAGLDEQMEIIRGLHATLGHSESDCRAIDKAAIRCFWFFSAGAFILLVAIAVLAAIFLL